MARASQTRPAAQIVLISMILSSQLLQTESANILFFIAFGGPSHRIAMQPLANALADKGHNVTFLVQDIPKDNSNIQYYSPKKVTEYFQNMRGAGGINFYDMRASGLGQLQSFFVQSFGVKVCEMLYTDSSYLEWINENKFDLVILDGLFNECGYGLAHAHNAKTILFSISTVLPWAIDSIGIPDETSFIPDCMFGFSPEMSFLKRVASAFMPVFWRIVRRGYYLPRLTSTTREATANVDFPSYEELEKDTSLVFVNTHASQEYPRSLPPNVIPVGGISWVEKSKPIPKKFEDFISKGKEGFVYISFGSFIDFLTFPDEVQEKFINALRRLPNIQFIWKLNKTPENLPSNILIEKWMPQQDLLRHPKIRGFITHSGIGGVNEAIYTAVPLILFPIFTEQDYNAHLAEQKGFGIKMEIAKLTEDDLEKAIMELLTNDNYKVNIEKVRSQFLDRPMKALDTAVWWTEYTLRQDTKFLRSSNVNQHFWVKRQLDVWFFIIFAVISFNVTWMYVLYKLVKKCCSSSNKKVSKTKQKKN